MLGDEAQEQKKEESSTWKILLPFIIVIIAIVLTIILTSTTQQPQNSNNKQTSSTTVSLGGENITTTPKPLEYGNLTITVSDVDTGAPLEGVTVKLNDQQKITNSQGKVVFTVNNQDQTGTLYFSKDGYENNSFDVILSQGTQELKLYKQTQSNQDNFNTDNPNPSPTNVTVNVYVDDQLAQNGTVELRAEDDTLIDSKPITDGIAIFENIPNENVYAVFSDDQFTDQKSDVFSSSDGQTNIYAYSDSYANQNGMNSTQGIQTQFILINNEGRPGELQIFSGNSTVVFKGEISELKPLHVGLKEGEYTASFLTLGQVIKIDSFQAGDNVTIDFNSSQTDSQKQNSVALVVKTFLNQKPIDGVTIDVMQGDNIITEETTQNASVELSLEKGDYEIKASKDYAKGFANITLNSGQVISIELNTGKYLLKTTMLDENNSKVNGFVIVTQDNLTQKCPTVNGICLTPVQEGEVSITGKAEGYEDTQAERTITSDDTIELNLTRNIGKLEESTINFQGFYKDGQKNSALTYAQEYNAVFSVMAKTDSILYFRVSDEKDLLGITGQSLNSKNVKFKSSTYSDQTNCGESINFNEGKLGYKWTAVRITKGVQNIAFKVLVADNIIGSVSTQVYYKIGLESDFSCHDDTQNAGIIINGIGADNKTGGNQAQYLNALNTPSDPESESMLIFTVDKDGVLKANRDSQEFIIDNIFPGDSTPFKVPDGVILTFEGPNQNCFSQVTVGNNKYFLLKTSFVDPKSTCPIKEDKGKLIVDQTTKTILKAAYLDAKGSATIIRLPLTITVRNVDSTVALPKADSPASYSRTIFIGTQSIIPTQEILGSLTQDFNGPDLQLKLWDGQNTPLTLTVNNLVVKTWNWRQKPEAIAPTESLAPNTQTSGADACTGFFCKPNELQQAATDFKKNAVQLFASTYNRRGEGRPYTLIYGTNYNPKYFGGFMASANNPLSTQGFDVKYTAQPATYKAWGQASTATNGIVNVDWKANVYEIQGKDYVSGNCINNASLEGFQQSNGCVITSDTPNLPTTNQINNPSPTPSPSPSPNPSPSPSPSPSGSPPPLPTPKVEYKLQTAIIEFTPLSSPISIQTISTAGKSYALLKGSASALLKGTKVSDEIKTACTEADYFVTGANNGVVSVPFIETGFIVNFSDPKFSAANVSKPTFLDDLFASEGGTQGLGDYLKDVTVFPSLISEISGNRDVYGNLNGQQGSTQWNAGLAEKYFTVPRWTFMRFTPETKITSGYFCNAVCREKPASISIDIRNKTENNGDTTIMYTAVIRKGVTKECRSVMPEDAQAILKMSKPEDIQNIQIQNILKKQTVLTYLGGTMCDLGKQIQSGLLGIVYKSDFNIGNAIKQLGGINDKELQCNSQLGILEGPKSILKNAITINSLNVLRKDFPTFFQQYQSITGGAKFSKLTGSDKKLEILGCKTSLSQAADPKTVFNCVWNGVSNLFNAVAGENTDCEEIAKENAGYNFMEQSISTVCDSEFLTTLENCGKDKTACGVSVFGTALDLYGAYDDAFKFKPFDPTKIVIPLPTFTPELNPIPG